MRATYDIEVIREWQRRIAKYNTDSAWLRFPMYGGTLVVVLVGVLLPATMIPYIFGAFCANLCFVGFFLSKYSRGSLKCPHCAKTPYFYFNTRNPQDVCKHCGYWLVETHVLPLGMNKQLTEGEDIAMRVSMMNVCFWWGFLMLPFSLTVQAEASNEASKSPREFVQEFYKWYVPKALNSKISRAWEVALKYKSAAFSRELAQQLTEDSAAQTKCEELVGIDFDPFLNTQDPANGYEVGEIKQSGKHYRVDLYSMESGKRSDRSPVSAEIVEIEGHLVFVNFFYSDGEDLLKILKMPRSKCESPRTSSQK